MTAECALTKLSYLLGKALSVDHVRNLIQKNLRGELTDSSADGFNAPLCLLNSQELLVQSQKNQNEIYFGGHSVRKLF